MEIWELENHNLLPSSDLGLGYIYCDYGDQKEQTVENILGAILTQLLDSLHEIPKDILDFYHERHTDSKKPLGSEDADHLLRIICTKFRRVYICPDALDELHLHDGPLCIQIFLTGRPHVQGAVKEFFKREQDITIEARESDIRRFIESEIGGPNDIDPKAMDELLRKDIFEIIVDSAKGTFLLPIFQIRVVLQATTLRDREDALKKLLSGLDQIFAGTLSRIKQQPFTVAERAIKIIACIHLSKPQIVPIGGCVCGVARDAWAQALRNLDDLGFNVDYVISSMRNHASNPCMFGFLIEQGVIATVLNTGLPLEGCKGKRFVQRIFTKFPSYALNSPENAAFSNLLFVPNIFNYPILDWLMLIIQRRPRIDESNVNSLSMRGKITLYPIQIATARYHKASEEGFFNALPKWKRGLEEYEVNVEFIWITLDSATTTGIPENLKRLRGREISMNPKYTSKKIHLSEVNPRLWKGFDIRAQARNRARSGNSEPGSVSNGSEEAKKDRNCVVME
ncbi:hypothetical protein TSTA_065100 [Talaromyces stipitatus ATCC 10500]|uniref:Nephrocystin 3-like N-terminal domain-containing protein n=1 Tax=Talaromyces stipitatus (strain ATCC 10500 / CBS 375.48 / QM 6759 / NRRL 1006) TaxID=441959 RepID=B8LTH2_TALSN|nr:uncharacterized protein TSTA_065100 [Talaromyces stipitatus ATCC 10500]EED23050.1 hypothetical protein TSTA_065100 [Talaromyces stipitatus ATCC 10500]